MKASEFINEHIVKVKGGYELKSKKTGKNLGKYPTRAGAEKRERQVQYFKHAGEGVEEGLKDPADNPCWKGYHPVGTKKKNGKTVPNCVPNESVEFNEGADIRNRPVPQIQTAIARSKKIPNSKVIKLGPNRGFVVVDRSDPRPEVVPDLTVTGKVSNANQRYRDLYVQMRRLERKYNTDAPGHPELRDANWQKMLQNTKNF